MFQQATRSGWIEVIAGVMFSGKSKSDPPRAPRGDRYASRCKSLSPI